MQLELQQKISASIELKTEETTDQIDLHDNASSLIPHQFKFRFIQGCVTIKYDIVLVHRDLIF